MAVYVDDYSAPYRNMLMCHMVADTLEELHDMAERVGLRREWFQDKHNSPHYDLCKTKRAVAIELGAKPVTSRQVIEVLIKYRKRNAQ